jgi:hypothetical protein
MLYASYTLCAAFQIGGCEQHQEVCSGLYVLENDALEVAASNTAVVNKYVKPMMFQVLEYSQCPRGVRPSITDKNGFLDLLHVIK